VPTAGVQGGSSDPGIYALAFSSFFFSPLHLAKGKAGKHVCFCAWLGPGPAWQTVSVARAGVRAPRSAQRPRVPATGLRHCWGPCAPASCPGSTEQRDGCSCRLFINMLKPPRLAERPGDTATAAPWSLHRALLFPRLLLLCSVVPWQPCGLGRGPVPLPWLHVS